MAKWALLMFIATVVGVGVTTVGVIYVKRTLDQNRAAVEAAIVSAEAAQDSVDVVQRIGEAQVRAYLSCTGGKYEVHGTSFHLRPYLTNNGQSPANNIRIVAKISSTVLDGWQEHNIPKLRNIKSGEGIGHCQAIPGGGRSEGFVLWLWGDLGEELFEIVGKNDSHFSIIGRITWTDVFDRDQTFTFILDDSIGQPVADALGAIRRSGELGAFNQSPHRPEQGKGPA
jgi:hypothetical protein